MNVAQKRRKTGKLYAFGRFLLRLFYVPVYRLKVLGRENVPTEGPVLLCCNHVAMKDPIMLSITQKRQVCYMAKEELFHNKLVGGVLRGVGTFPVKRGTGGADALEDAYEILEQDGVVGVFIEGHRSKNGELQNPKTGAALLAYRTGSTVVPVCITAQDGKLPRPFKKTMIRFGKPITAEDLHMEDDSSMQMRRASRNIMSGIKQLREDSLRDFGVPVLPPEIKTTTEHKENG